MGALNQLLAAYPTLANPLVGAWAAWLTAGVALAVWYYRARKQFTGYTVVAPAPNRPAMRPKSGVRPPSGVRSAKPQPKPDAFAELQTLLDGPEEQSPFADNHLTNNQ